jgi:hypothetical protein
LHAFLFFSSPQLRRMQTAIGVASGLSYCGLAGSDKRCEYTAVGGKVGSRSSLSLNRFPFFFFSHAS